MSIVVSLIALIATLSGIGGYYADNLVRDLVRSQLSGAERLEVRVEAIPNYKLVSGEIDRLRLAGRGLYVRPDLRVARLDVETDGILVDLGSTPRLRRPLQAAVNLELTEADLNRALNTPEILKTLQGLKAELPGGVGGSGQPEVLNFTDPHITLIGENQVVVQSVVRVEGKTKTLLVTFRSGLAVDQYIRLRLVNPVFTLDDVPVPSEIADVFLSGLNQVVDLEPLAKQGIDARILKLEVAPGQLNFVGFARIEKIPGTLR